MDVPDHAGAAALRKVLIVAYYFPPMGLSGVQRTLKFAKYLPDYGWEPTVLTVTPTGYFAQDYTLLDDLPRRRVEIERVGSLDPNRLFRGKGVVRMPSERWRKILTFMSDSFFIPDNKILWKRKAVRAAEKLFERKQFDLIFATGPPFTDFLIGLELQRAWNRPLVLDYRDPWLEYPFKYYPTPLHRMLNARGERDALHAASKIITTNRRVKELILNRHAFLDHGDVVILPQGYDPEDFRNGAPAQAAGRKMRIAHAGVFYGDRTPKYFLKALRKVFDAHPAMRGRVESVFVGNMHEEHLKLIASMGLQESVVTTGYLDHARCVEEIRSSDVLWLMLTNDRQSPGKLYEYLGARKPILACVPEESFLRQTVAEAGAGVSVDPDDVDGIASAIVRFYEQFNGPGLPKPREDVVTRYDRAGLTRELSVIFGFLAE
jgi:glycosyltransferase involved in cell wall biosynthesis